MMQPMSQSMQGMTQTLGGSAAGPAQAAMQPMLSRVADAVFWMSRYVERAEHLARLVLVNTHVLVDAGELAPELSRRFWNDLMDIGRPVLKAPAPPRPALDRQAIVQHLLFDVENRSSAVNCVARARENARAIREIISAEMWECINSLYWATRPDQVAQEENPVELCRHITTASFTFQGLTDQTITHGQAWLFASLGRYLERIDMTCRIFCARSTTLVETDELLEPALRNIQWMALLRACCSIEVFRRSHGGDVHPSLVAEFIILRRSFPRSMYFCVAESLESLRQLRGLVGGDGVDDFERILGQLTARLQYASVSEHSIKEIVQFVLEINAATTAATAAMQERFFLR